MNNRRMLTLTENTLIQAPVQRCFDLSLSIDLHRASTARTGERAIAGVTSGLIGLNESVTWRARHFCVWQEMTVQITQMERPKYFQDTMLRGPFRSFQHDHYFVNSEGGHTEMTDVLRFSAPLPVAGRMAELVLRPYLRRFLRERNSFIRRIAESEDWRSFFPA